MIPEYSTYAKIEITKNGYRHLSLNGYTFGETKVSDRSVYWRCTANLRGESGKSKRCVTHVVTEVRNGSYLITIFSEISRFNTYYFLSLRLSIFFEGYEMIWKLPKNHNHPKPIRKRRARR